MITAPEPTSLGVAAVALATTAFVGTLYLYLKLRERIGDEGDWVSELLDELPLLIGALGAATCCAITKPNAVVIPAAAVAEIPAAVELLQRREAVILEAARAPGFDIEKLRKATGDAADIH